AASTCTPVSIWTFVRFNSIGCRRSSTASGRTTSGLRRAERSTSQIQKITGPLWSNPFAFMPKKDQSVFPFRVLHALHPFNQIRFLVGGSAQTEVSPPCRADDLSQRFFVRIGNHQRAILRSQ